MKLVIESNRRRLTFDNEGAFLTEMWVMLDSMAGGSSIQTLSVCLHRADVEKLVGLCEAWLHEQEAPPEPTKG